MPRPSKAVIEKNRRRVDGLKNKFERAMKSRFHSWQIKVFTEFKRQISKGASIFILPPDLKIDLRILLISHYREVAEAFVPGLEFPEIKQAIGGDPLNPEDEEDDDLIIFDWMLPGIFADILKGLNAQINLNLPIHEQSIINTTELMGTQSVALARIDQADPSVIMRNKLASRETTVSITETDWIAEASMGTALGVTTPKISIADERQLTAIQEISPNITLKELDIEKTFAKPIFLEAVRRELSIPQKFWVTMGDRRVRTSHAAVNFTQLPATEAFKLKGGLLMFPGDSSLGVSFFEIVNCRCHAMYF